MSSNKKIRSRLNKLFDDIKQTEQTGQPAEKPASQPAPSLVALPQQPLHTRSLSPATLQARQPVVVAQTAPNLLSIPFQTGDSWNLLQLEQDEIRPWQEEEQSLVRQIADQLGLALQNAQLYQETQKRASEMATLNEIVRAVSAQIDLKEVLNAAYQKIVQSVPADAFTVALYDANTGMMSFPLVIDEGRRYDEPDTPLNPENYTGKTLLTGKPTYEFITPEEAATRKTVDGAIGNTSKLSGSLLFLPLSVGANTIGCMSVQSYNFFAYSQDDIALLENIANQISVGIQNARLFAETQAKEANFRNLIENAPEAIAVLDPEAGIFTDPNENACQLFKLTREEFSTHSLTKLSAEIQADGRPTAEVATEKINAALQGATQIFEWRHKDAQGQVIPCEIHLSRLPGERPLLRATIVDITERKRAEEALRQSETQLSNALRLAKMGSFIIDLNHQVLITTDELLELFGRTLADEGSYEIPVQDMLERFVHPEDAHLLAQTLQNASVSKPGENEGELEIRQRHSSGKVIWTRITYQIVRNAQGQAEALSGSTQDITERKLAELDLDRRARQLQATSEIASATASILDEQRLLETFIHLTQRRFGLYHAHMLLTDKNRQELVVKACGWPAGDPHEGSPAEDERIALQAPHSFVAKAARDRKTMINNNVHLDPHWHGNPHVPEVQSELAVPVLAGDQLLGILNVHSNQLNFFSDADVAIMTTLAAQIGTSLQNVRLFAQAQARARREQLLREITARVRGSTDPDIIMRTAVREIGQALGMQAFINLGSAEQLTQPPQPDLTGKDEPTQPGKAPSKGGK